MWKITGFQEKKKQHTIVQRKAGEMVGRADLPFSQNFTVLFLSVLVTSSQNEHEKMVSPPQKQGLDTTRCFKIKLYRKSRCYATYILPTVCRPLAVT